MYSDYSSAYAFRAEAYIGKEKWAEATDDIIKVLSIDGNNKAFSLMQSLEEPALGMLVTKMKIQMTKSPNNAYWPYCIGVLHEDKEEYEAAIHFYEEANRKDADDINLCRIAQCNSIVILYAVRCHTFSSNKSCISLADLPIACAMTSTDMPLANMTCAMDLS